MKWMLVLLRRLKLQYKAKICKKPVAGYDKEKKAAYVEYANGERKYAE